MIRVILLSGMIVLLAACSTGRGDMAWRLMERQQEEQAMLRRYEADQSRAQQPRQQDWSLDLIREAMREERYFAALAYINAHEAEFGPAAEISLLKADALRLTRHYEASRGVYERLLATGQRGLARRGLGLLAGAQGNYQESVEHLREAARLMPADGRLLSDLGFALMRAGDIQGARMPLGQAAELEPDNGTILSNLVLYLLLVDEPARADEVRHQAGLSDSQYQSIVRLLHDIRVQQAAGPAVVRQLSVTPAQALPAAFVPHQPLLR